MTNKYKILHIGITGAGLLLMPLSVAADTVDELMRQLKAKGILTEQEYTALSGHGAVKPSSPQTKADTVDKLMRQLKAKGILTEQEYTALHEQHAAERPPTQVAMAETSPALPIVPAPAPKLGAKGIPTGQQYSALGEQRAAEPPPTQVAAAEEVPPAQPIVPAPSPGGPFVQMMEKGVGLHIGPVGVSIAGSINAFYVQDMPESPGPDTTVLGGLAFVNDSDSAAVRNGLLPGNFTANVKTRQRGLDIGATFGLYPGLNSVDGVGGANSAGNPRALGTSGIDFRQQFLTVGNDGIGTFKAGRDIGMFASDAILNDFSLVSVGSPFVNAAPSNTALGRIGLGYIYTDFIPQIAYRTPSFAGLEGSIGVFTPLEAVNFSGVSGTLTAHDEPGFQGKLTYKPDLVSVENQLWADFITQQLTSAGGTDALPGGDSVRAYGFDLGDKFTFGPATLTAYGYFGRALGSTGLFFDAVSPTGGERDSYGYYVQGTYKILERLTLGVSQGASYLSLADGEVNPELVERNASQLVGFQYQLTDWLKLVTEYVHTHSKAHGGNSANENTFAAGTVLFF